ncbi:GntR family transcriptional regulator [Bacillaceae bacterium SIJ1]|uniref:GntR family transcriptional regulator n=1 Tax=Litoribacterium kuwaitense TaxID=1398745 RepID=UPI0013E9F004|nr:GntR family transcriptional regulator [Litoribacterium kuwaitense]NGP43957.1 GntR family transcriptional regulator [Litoribacterium kuwaitense]
MLDKSSSVPMYYQLYERLKTAMITGELAAGEMIPSERELAQSFQISRMTARQAITELVHDGYVTRKKGKGTFVAKRKFAKTLLGVKSFTEEMKERGLSLQSTLLSYEKKQPPAVMRDALKLSNAQDGHIFERLRHVGKDMLAIEKTCLPVTLFPNWTPQQAKTSLYAYIENDCGMTIDHARQEIEAAVADRSQAKKLQIDVGEPLLVITRCTYNDEQVPIEWTKTTLKADQYKFMTEMKR